MGGKMPFIYKNRINRRIASGSPPDVIRWRVQSWISVCIVPLAPGTAILVLRKSSSNQVSSVWLNVGVRRQRGPKAGHYANHLYVGLHIQPRHTPVRQTPV